MTDFFSSILQYLEEADQSLLLSINSYHNGFFDTFMFLVSDKWIWIPLYVAMFYVIVKNKRRETVFIVFGIVLTVLCADLFASGLCKPLFHRFRPAQDPGIGSLVHTVFGNCGDQYGFISSHAANTVGVALFTTLLIRNGWYGVTIWSWSLINCYSRMYLGLHYMGDILCGAVAGALIGWFFFWLYRKIITKWMPQFRYNPHRTNSRSNIDFPMSDICSIIWTYAVTFSIIIVMSHYNMSL